MVSNFSVIPICWVLTDNSEMAFFLSIHSLRVCLFSLKTCAVQRKIIAKLVNSKVNFTQKTDITLIALCFMQILVFSVKFRDLAEISRGVGWWRFLVK